MEEDKNNRSPPDKEMQSKILELVTSFLYLCDLLSNLNIFCYSICKDFAHKWTVVYKILNIVLQIKSLKENLLNMEQNEVRTCNCKNSKWLKLYWECFKAGAYWNSRTCNCIHWENNNDNEEK